MKPKNTHIFFPYIDNIYLILWNKLPKINEKITTNNKSRAKEIPNETLEKKFDICETKANTFKNSKEIFLVISGKYNIGITDKAHQKIPIKNLYLFICELSI